MEGSIFDLLDQLDDNIPIDDETITNDKNGESGSTMTLLQAQIDNKDNNNTVELWDTQLVKVKPSQLVWAKIKDIWYPAYINTDTAQHAQYGNIIEVKEGYTVVEYIKIPKKNPMTHQMALVEIDKIKPYNYVETSGKKQTTLQNSFLKKSNASNDEWSASYISNMEKGLNSKYGRAKGKYIYDQVLLMARSFLAKALEVDKSYDENNISLADSHKRKLDDMTDFDFTAIIQNSNKNQAEDLKAGDFITFNDKVLMNLRKTSRVVEIILTDGKDPVVKLENDDIIYRNDLVRKLSLGSNGEPDKNSGSSRRIDEYNLIASKIIYESLERKIRKSTMRDNLLDMEDD
jgi:hypothetical protein